MKNSPAATRPLCILHSGDAPLRHRLAGIVQDRAYVCHAPDAHRLEELLGGTEPLLLFVDVRAADARELLPRLSRLHPHAVCIALGEPQSLPMQLAEEAGVYRAVSVGTSDPALGDLTERAIERVGWMQETQMLRDELARVRTMHQHGGGGGGRGGPGRPGLNLQPLVRATQNMDRLEDLFNRVVEGVAGAAMVSRVGLFYQTGDGGYRLRAGRCCLDDTAALEFGERDPLVRWLQRHPRLITRASLDHIHDPGERALLRRTLDLLGAETFIPLNLRGRVLGWLFTGQTDGYPFDHSDHPELSFLSEHVVQALENTLRHQEVVSQKLLGDSLLQMMPTAIVTTDAAGMITWCNAPAEAMFPALARSLANASLPGRAAAPVPAEDLGTRIGSLLRDTLAGQPATEPCALDRTLTGGRALVVRTRQLTGGGQCLGAVALVEDRTRQVESASQGEHLERARFWRELAAGISHEIRNPLVAIKTFTQLLPQRHTDEEFRTEFKEMVSREVNRLDGIVAQIESFAQPPTAEPERADLAALLKTASEGAGALAEHKDPAVKITVEEVLPLWRGDTRALTQAFQHLFLNSMEAAVRKKVRPIIKVRVQVHKTDDGVVNLKVDFNDNGGGLPAEVRDNAFSPFASTKAQGLGLGLPIAQRVVLDHGGRIELDSGTIGTGISILLPLAPEPPPDPLKPPRGWAGAAAYFGPNGPPPEIRRGRRPPNRDTTALDD